MYSTVIQAYIAIETRREDIEQHIALWPWLQSVGVFAHMEQTDPEKCPQNMIMEQAWAPVTIPCPRLPGSQPSHPLCPRRAVSRGGGGELPPPRLLQLFFASFPLLALNTSTSLAHIRLCFLFTLSWTVLTLDNKHIFQHQKPLGLFSS